MPNVQVILKEQIKGLGSEADVVGVKRGFARNFLLPQGKAYEATKGNLRHVENLKAIRAEREAKEIAEAEKITRSYITRLLNLTLLAPDIADAILDGRQPKGMQLEELTRAMPGVWEEQRAGFLVSSTQSPSPITSQTPEYQLAQLRTLSSGIGVDAFASGDLQYRCRQRNSTNVPS